MTCGGIADTKKRIPFAYLADIADRFHTDNPNPRRWQSAGAYELNDSFSGVLANRLEYFNNNPQADKLTHLQAEIEDVKSVMVENIEKVLERGERIELLVDRTDALNSQAQQFKKKSTKLKKAMWWKNFKMQLIIGLIVIIALWLILSLACKFDFSRCTGKDKKK